MLLHQLFRSHAAKDGNPKSLSWRYQTAYRCVVVTLAQGAMRRWKRPTRLGVTAFAGSIGAARSTIHLWATRHAEFRAAIEAAAAIRQYRLERDVRELDGQLTAGQVRLRLRVLARLDPESWRK
jgi:hypothetical protein